MVVISSINSSSSLVIATRQIVTVMDYRPEEAIQGVPEQLLNGRTLDKSYKG